jgi:hypothetical protein
MYKLYYLDQARDDLIHIKRYIPKIPEDAGILGIYY